MYSTALPNPFECITPKRVRRARKLLRKAKRNQRKAKR